MWVLVLAIASFLLFFSIVLLLWLAETLESRNIQHKRNGCSEQPFMFLSIAQAFEPICAVLWEAPIHAMQLIQSAGTQGTSVDQMWPIFNEAASRFPEIYDGCGFEQWVQFLEDTQLICWIGHKVGLTQHGREFLEYRFTTESLQQA
jgi:hypothetical protein